MEWQSIIVGLIILGAAALTALRLYHFFANPAHKCEGCSGCSLSDLKRDIGAGKKELKT
ncbi:MAG: FeoB-associated Cys-rich membrane protein [Bacteroidota bacterium]